MDRGTQNPPCPYVGIVSISTGSNTRVAVEPQSQLGAGDPGGLGSVGIVDLNQQSTNAITAISRTNNGITDVVTVTVQSTTSSSPLSVQVGDAVQIQNISFPAGTDPTIAAQAPSFNGFYSVTSVGPASNQFSYTQTGTAAAGCGDAVDSAGRSAGSRKLRPAGCDRWRCRSPFRGLQSTGNAAGGHGRSHDGRRRFVFQFDRSIRLPLALTTNNAADVGTSAGGFNPLTNTVVAVNFFANTLSVIDPPSGALPGV